MIRFLVYSILCGLILSAGFPTYGFPFFLFCGFLPLFFLENQLTHKYRTKQKRKLFPLVYLAFFLWNIISVWWLGKAKHPDGTYALEGFLFAVCANSFLMSWVFISYSWVKKITGDYIGSFFFVCLWISFEKFHFEWEFSFPWLTLGNGFAQYYQWIQWYEKTGTLGGTLWVLVVNFVLYHGIREYQLYKQKKYLYRSICVLFFLICIPFLISYFMYKTYAEKGEEMQVAVIQPKIDPYTEKYQTVSTQLVEDLLLLSKQNANAKTDFIVFPETAFPGRGNLSIDNLHSDIHLIQIKNFLKNYPKTTIISGVQAYKKHETTEEVPPTASKYGNDYVSFYNAGLQVNNQKEIPIYFKSKLVPGVEIFPYIKMLKPLLGDVLLDFGGTVSSLGTQQERVPFSNTYNRAVVAPIICYEAIYGEYITDFIKNKANVLFMMSNDSWWENSDGHKQLLCFSRLRAIETRRSIVRAANSGISAIINQRGDIVKKMDYDKKGAITGTIQLNNTQTTYVLYGDYIARIALFIMGILFAFALTQKILSKKP